MRRNCNVCDDPSHTFNGAHVCVTRRATTVTETPADLNVMLANGWTIEHQRMHSDGKRVVALVSIEKSKLHTKGRKSPASHGG